mgnify:CR=1 FL=1
MSSTSQKSLEKRISKSCPEVPVSEVEESSGVREWSVGAKKNTGREVRISQAGAFRESFKISNGESSRVSCNVLELLRGQRRLFRPLTLPSPSEGRR